MLERHPTALIDDREPEHGGAVARIRAAHRGVARDNVHLGFEHEVFDITIRLACSIFRQRCIPKNRNRGRIARFLSGEIPGDVEGVEASVDSRSGVDVDNGIVITRNWV